MRTSSGWKGWQELCAPARCQGMKAEVGSGCSGPIQPSFGTLPGQSFLSLPACPSQCLITPRANIFSLYLVRISLAVSRDCSLPSFPHAERSLAASRPAGELKAAISSFPHLSSAGSAVPPPPASPRLAVVVFLAPRSGASLQPWYRELSSSPARNSSTLLGEFNQGFLDAERENLPDGFENVIPEQSMRGLPGGRQALTNSSCWVCVCRLMPRHEQSCGRARSGCWDHENLPV